MAWYRTGLISVSNSATVTGNGSCSTGGYTSKAACEAASGTWTGTAFLDNVRKGDAFICGDKVREISAVISDTELVLTTTYPDTVSGGAYLIAPVQGYSKELADNVAELIASYSGVSLDLAGAQAKFKDGTLVAPGISFLNDLNTGIYHSTDGTYSFVSNGSSIADITTSGLVVPSIDINGGTIDDTPIGATTRAAGNFTTLDANGNATLGDAEATDTHAIKGATTLLANSASAALKVTQTGAGNAFVVEDSTSTDSSPFAIDALGKINIGSLAQYTMAPATPYTQWNSADNQYASIGLISWQAGTGTCSKFIFGRGDSSTVGDFSNAVDSGDNLGSFHWNGSDGTTFIEAASINAAVDGTPGTNNMPGRLIFSTTADGASLPTERYRINNAGNHFFGNTTTNTNSTLVVVNGEISETTNGTQYKLVNQSDIGTAPNEIPLNQYLGEMAYQDSSGVNISGGVLAGRDIVDLVSDVSANSINTGLVQSDSFIATTNMLLRGGGTNLLTYSEQFNNAAWTKTRSSITANAVTAPDGTLTADKLVEDTSTDNTHVVFETITASASTAYVLSVVAKAAERSHIHISASKVGMTAATAVFNLSTGLLVSETNTNSTGIDSLGGGWFRVWISITTDSTSSGLNHVITLHNGTTAIYTGDGTSGIYIWGAQLVTGTNPGPYTKTVEDNIVSAGPALVDAPTGIAETLPVSVTPQRRGSMTFQLTDNTTLVIKVKGSDGVVRSNTLTLA